jgi:hypothetical protein
MGASALLALSLGFAAAFLIQWPKPVSMVFAGTALLSGFGALLVFCKPAGREYALQARKAVFLASGCFGLAFIGLAWKYRETAPAFSLASLIAVALICLGAVTSFFITRSIPEAGGTPLTR